MPQLLYGKIIRATKDDIGEIKLPTTSETDWARICFSKGYAVWLNAEQFKGLMSQGIEILPQLTFENKDVEA
jgi:hypothetical protein